VSDGACVFPALSVLTWAWSTFFYLVPFPHCTFLLPVRALSDVVGCTCGGLLGDYDADICCDGVVVYCITVTGRVVILVLVLLCSSCAYW
jgi:hypothetical protein